MTSAGSRPQALRTDREQNHDLALTRVVLMRQHLSGIARGVQFQDLDTETDEELLDETQQCTLVLGLE